MAQPFVLSSDSHIHIVGIGGAGMSAVAHILLDRGIAVSGSDRQSNDITADLALRGATLFEGHGAENIVGADALFVSSAVQENNPEIVAARNAGLPILTRREFFRQLLPDKAQIAVAGTHGKTTTTGMIVHLLRETGNDPSYIIGGKLNSTGDNAHVGQGRAFVVEADEYGGMFLGLAPEVAVITNIEHDHPDIFPTIEDVLNTFRKFVGLLPVDGTLVVCADDPLALSLTDQQTEQNQTTVTYGIQNTLAHWQAILTASDDPALSRFTVRHGGHEYPAALLLPGTHNVLNALAALAALEAFGVAPETAIPHLPTFTGTGRRFELMGQSAGISILSDYGHHPTAIRATLQAARQRYPAASIWAVWQPHTYSRSRTLATEFASAFSDANHVLITDIYAAREKPAPGDPTGSDLAALVTATGHTDARYSGSLVETTALLERETKTGDVVIILSAGDAPQIGTNLLQALQNRVT